MQKFKNFTLDEVEQEISDLNYLNLIRSNLTSMHRDHISYSKSLHI